MPVTCPCCRAANATGPACRRCKADLGLLFSLDTERESLLVAAADHTATGDYPAALTAATAAESLRRGDDARRAMAAAHLGNRDFAAAWACYSAVRDE